MLSLMKVCACTTRNLYSKCKKLWGTGCISAFYVRKGLLRMTLRNWKSCFPEIHWLKITSYWLILILIFVMLISVQVYYFHCIYHLKLVIFRHFENSIPFFSRCFLQIWSYILKPLALSNFSGCCYPCNNFNLKSVAEPSCQITNNMQLMFF